MAKAKTVEATAEELSVQTKEINEVFKDEPKTLYVIKRGVTRIAKGDLEKLEADGWKIKK
jgi:hypothetical protein